MAMDLGSVVGEYEVIDKLGAGGIGQVYRVRHIISHRVEALKVLLPAPLATAETTDRFIREIRVLASLSHPNIAALHNAIRHDGELMMIMEYVEGVTLRQRLLRERLTIGRSIEYACQALSGLAYAHARGVIHRDVKPSNIMITPTDQVKLLDFGLAASERATELTRTGMLMGSPHYMSPEQVMGERVDARSDLYSMGVTLYQLLTGKLPIDGGSDFAIATAHLHDVPVPAQQVNPMLPRHLSDVVMKSLEKSAENRYQTADEYLRALQVFHGDETQTLVPVPSMAREASSDRVHRGDSAGTPARQTRTLTGAAVLQEVIRELAQFVGPIARILVNRAAAQARTLDELYAAVGREIASDKDRKRFLATRARYSTRPQDGSSSS